MDKASEIVHEQVYFDVAYEARERHLQGLRDAPANAVNSKASADLRKFAEEQTEIAAGIPTVIEGRIDFDDGETFYLGKQKISSADSDVLVIHFAQDVVKPYYTATVADPKGLARKRAFDAERNRIRDYDDVVFAELAERVEALVGPYFEDALLRDLERNRTLEMEDIVQTITAAQYDIMETPLNRLLVIQGGPGTGKTAIGLHRVAYLLHRDESTLTETQVLVVGPSMTFGRYIRGLLPSLGDADVAQTNLHSLGPIRSDRRPEADAVAILKADDRMASLLVRALGNRVRVGEGDEFLEVQADVRPISLEMSAVREQLSAITDSWANDQQRIQAYSAARNQMRRWLATATSGDRFNAPSASQIDQALERLWPATSAAAFVRELYGSRERLLAAAGADFSAQDVANLYRQPADRVGDERWSDADVAVLDEAEFLINGSPPSYQHVLVDEAQDLSPMQIRSLKRRSSNGSMTIVGDMAQATTPWALGTWKQIASGLEQECQVDMRDLLYGYRVPQQVMELAAPLLEIAAPGVSAPLVVRDTGAPELIDVDLADMPLAGVKAARDYAGLGLAVGVICSDGLRDEVMEVFQRQGVVWTDATRAGLGQGINLLSPAECKGLEFDATVVIGPRQIAGNDPRSVRLLYIALTRTTRFLTVVHDGQLHPTFITGDSSPVESVGVDPPAPDPFHGSRHEPGAPITQGGLNLGDIVADAAAKSVSLELRRSVSADLWIQVLNVARRELGISVDDFLEILADEE